MGVEEPENRAEAPTKNVAVVFGSTGLVGKEIVRNLLSKSTWKVYGIARRPDRRKPIQSSNYHFVSCDLTDPSETRKKLCFQQERVTHLFWVTWATRYALDSPDCCDLNRLMMSNALDSILPNAVSLKHVSLQTGTKHYVSLKRPSDSRKTWVYDEDSPRANAEHNFYYVLEDLLRERIAAAAGKIAWSVHRPGLIMGCSDRTLFNFVGSLCVYGSICKHLNLEFVFGGRKECWEEMFVDGSDARLVADQHVWGATDETLYSAGGQAFNAINGSRFTWREIWPLMGSKFGVAAEGKGLFSEEFRFAEAMSEKGGVWKEIVEREGLVETEMEELANWEFVDVLFRCPVKMLGSRSKVDSLGFTTRYETLDSIMHWIDVMRDEKLIPR